MIIDDEKRMRVLDRCNKPAALGGLLGLPYDEQGGCLRLIEIIFDELGIQTKKDWQKDVWRFEKVDAPEFGVLAVFSDVTDYDYHVCFMLDTRKGIQSSSITNGVGKIDVYAEYWRAFFKGFYRYKPAESCSMP
jgi:hypothetical protein